MSREPPFWVVGIGAGSGGLRAIQLLFAAMPANPPAAFVISQQVWSEIPDPLAAMLGIQTAMPIIQADAVTPLEAGRIHLVPPETRMVLLKDRLVPFEPAADDDAERTVLPIDVLFHSLAVSANKRAIAVLLSGNNKDGLNGCASIRIHGGVVMAQHPESADFPDMPARIIENDLASAVATPSAIADLIWRQVSNPVPCAIAEPDVDRDERALRQIMGVLSMPPTLNLYACCPPQIAKHLHRRLVASKAPSLMEYALLLERDEAELMALRDHLLAYIPPSFYNPDALQALEHKVASTLVDKMSPDRPIRVWVPACASEEEAYLLAMLLLYAADKAGKKADFEIIASGHITSALNEARAGCYPRGRLQNLPTKLAERFLYEDGDQIAVSARLYRHVTFVDHDMLDAPPPDTIDLVSCQNVLHYFGAEDQRKALHACRKALRPGGFLFLGASDGMATELTGLALVHKTWRIYQKLAGQPVGQALTEMARAPRQRPAEPILPNASQLRSKAEPLASPREKQLSDDDLGRMLGKRQQMLEQTIDTLLLSNDTLRRKNQQLRDENHRLIHADATINNVATMIAHDLKAPLLTIERMAGDLHHAISARATDDEAMHWLRPMQMRIASLSRVVDDLLAFAREGLAECSDLRPVDFGDLLKETLRRIDVPTNGRVVINPPSLQIITRRIPLACILRNLLRQAIERVGNGKGMIRIDAKPSHRSLEITIADNGETVGERSDNLSPAIVRQLLEAVGSKLVVSTDGGRTNHKIRFSWPIKGCTYPNAARKNAGSDTDRTHAEGR